MAPPDPTTGAPAVRPGTAAVVDAPAPLPAPRGPVSAALLHLLRRRPWEVRVGDALWWDGLLGEVLADDDLQLALHCVYELHHRGLDGVPEEWEWQPDLLRAQQEWEQMLLAALESEVGAPHSLRRRGLEATVGRVVALGRRDLTPSPAEHVMREGTVEQLRELLVHRALAELRAGDGYAWLLPRISGEPKVALAELEAQTWGRGRLPLMRTELYRALLRSWGLGTDYGEHVDRLPGVTLLGTNLVTLLGLHRRWRGASLGHLACSEVMAALPTARLAQGHRRLGGAEEAGRWFDEQLRTEVQREELAATDAVGALLSAEPGLGGDVVFGAACARYVADLQAAHVLPRWYRGLSSLRDHGAGPDDPGR